MVYGPFSLDLRGLSTLIEGLAADGYRVLGPSIRDHAIVIDDIATADDLPIGWFDEQAPGHYRLQRNGGSAVFEQAVGPIGMKSWLYPARRTVWTAEEDDDGVRFEPATPDPRPLAFVGIRACDLAAMRILDNVLTESMYQDPDYAARRDSAFTVAVDCTSPAPTCFCRSMGTGPAAVDGFDLALTEVEGSFLGRVGSRAGEERLETLPHSQPEQAVVNEAHRIVEEAARSMERHLDASAREVLRDNPEHPRWESIAERCLACGNCTQVCPTCFCVTTIDGGGLGGAVRERRWDTCFSLDFSFMGGGPVRTSVASRYRQWMTHKLSSWVDQFGEVGCVGCGRCITWCPAGIDITQEAAALAGDAP